MNNDLTHIVCFSGGHSSALVAVEVARHFGKEHVVLLNHDIHPDSEEQDVKRFKKEVADYLGLSITYANHPQWDKMDQFDVVMQAKAFKVGSGSELCTSRLKTEPFMKYLAEHHADKNCVIYYGFDANERARIQRRSGILGAMGYRSDYPLAIWADRTIHDTREIGIEPPMQTCELHRLSESPQAALVCCLLHPARPLGESQAGRGCHWLFHHQRYLPGRIRA